MTPDKDFETWLEQEAEKHDAKNKDADDYHNAADFILGARATLTSPVVKDLVKIVKELKFVMNVEVVGEEPQTDSDLYKQVEKAIEAYEKSLK